MHWDMVRYTVCAVLDVYFCGYVVVFNAYVFMYLCIWALYRLWQHFLIRTSKNKCFYEVVKRGIYAPFYYLTMIFSS